MWLFIRAIYMFRGWSPAEESLADAEYKQAIERKESGEIQAAGYAYRRAAWAYFNAGNTKDAMIAFESSYDAFTEAAYEYRMAGDDDQASIARDEAAESFRYSSSLYWSRFRSQRLSRCLFGCVGLLALIIASIFILARVGI